MEPAATQLSTRSLLKTVTVWAILLALVVAGTRWRLQQVRRQEAERLLRQHGGITSTASALHAIRTEGRDGWGWLSSTFFNYVAAVDLSINAWPRQELAQQGSLTLPPANDETLELLWTFPHLKQLNLRGTHVTDAGLRHLVQLRDLEKLDISGTRVTAPGLRSFRAKKPGCHVINDVAWEFERSPLAEAYWLKKKLGL